MISHVQRLGRGGLDYCGRVGLASLFILRTVLRCPRRWLGVQLLFREIYQVGVLSLIIVVVSGLFIGMVISLQGFHTLQRFGAEQQLGQLIALSILRELGPVVTALLFAGRAGSALTAEIGLMRTTQQIASMEMMAVDPLWRVIAPRYWAGVITMPLLAMIFCVVAIYGGALVGVNGLGVDSGSFWSNMHTAVDFRTDVVNGLMKSIVFGFVVTWVAVFQGFYTEPTAPGVSRATTKTVVYSSLLVLGLDFVLTAVMLKGW